MVTAEISFRVVPENLDDDVVLSTAYKANASLVVSGGKHLLNLRRFRGIRIVTVNERLRGKFFEE